MPGPGWRVSSRCGPNGPCVSVALFPDGTVAVRDTKEPEGPILRFTREEWTAFLAGAADGEFTLAALNG